MSKAERKRQERLTSAQAAAFADYRRSVRKPCETTTWEVLVSVSILARLTFVATLTTAFLLAGPAAAASSNLFFSEYVEGSSNNKALEIYNPSGSPVTLTDAYSVQLFANGSPTPTATIPLVGSVADTGVFVLVRSTANPALLGAADQATTNFLFSGNDAVALIHDGTAIDVIGQIGVDPGVEWGSGDESTQNATPRRKAVVSAGDPDGSDPFVTAAGWDGFAIDTFDGLGSHAGPGESPDVGPCDATPTIEGTPFRDVLFGTSGDDVVHGYGGHDLILGLGGDDRICSGPGHDIVLGGLGNDIIDSGQGSDLVAVGNGDDVVLAGPGRDRLFGGKGNDDLDGGDGFDWCRGGAGEDTVSACEWPPRS